MNKSVCEEVANVLNNRFYSIDFGEFVMVKPIGGHDVAPRQVTIQEIANLLPYKRTTFSGTLEKLEYYYIQIDSTTFIDILVNLDRNEIWYRNLSENPADALAV